MLKGNCVVAQSGGPSAVINASLAGVISEALKSDYIETVYGSHNGIEGILNNNLINLNELFEGKQDDLDLLKITPAMFLGSCRHKMSEDENDEEYNIIFNVFREKNIKYFFYIGGNDSMDTVLKLSQIAAARQEDVIFMGVPKTIDNDLPITDHTPGFGSAAKFIATSIYEMSFDFDVYDKEGVLIVEVMGRNAGWLTASSVLARVGGRTAPQLIYLPEVAFDEDKFIEDIKTKMKEHKQVVVAVSEGIKNQDGKYISAQSENKDKFGHVMLNGAGKYLERLVADRLACKVRSVELNILQRGSAHLLSRTDNNEAFILGSEAVVAATAGHTGEMTIVKRMCNNPYSVKVDTCPIGDVANQEKKVPLEWITSEGNDVTDEMISYLEPLILGEAELEYEKGLPKYYYL